MDITSYRQSNIDATIDSVGYIDKKLPVCNFFDNVLLRKPDKLMILVYGIEGQPIYLTLLYDGKLIRFRVEHTDSGGSIYDYIGNWYAKRPTETSIYYELYQNENFIISMFSYRN